MKQTLTTLIVTLLLLFLSACSSPAAPSSPTSTPPPPTPSSSTPQLILTTGEWAPFVGEELDNYGLVAEVVSAVGQEMGVDITYEWHPWARTYQQAVDAKVWGTFPFSHNEERAQEMLFSDPIMDTPATVFFYYQEEPTTIQTPQDLQDLRLGGVLGYFYATLFEEAGLNYELTATGEQSLEKLRLGRIDLYPEVEAVGWHQIRNNFPDEIDNFGTMYFPWPVEDNEQPGIYLLVSPDYPQAEQLLTEFNIALQTIKDNGTYDQIMNKYGL
ncbi:MAG TPA: transporter substrate-binding domain-containing protein [Anaerolineae bacterium]|nr:transporter substrate-binding domain-containing protein [Anaerolineae bacterium]